MGLTFDLHGGSLLLKLLQELFEMRVFGLFSFNLNGF